MAQLICGVDIAKDWLDASIGPDGPCFRLTNDEAGLAQLVELCRNADVHLVVMEASGGYERLALASLWRAGLPVALANPRQVRRFAEALGRLEKTDRIDAGMIAAFGAVRKLAPTPPPSADQQALKAHVTHLRQLIRTRTSLRLQQAMAGPDARVGASFATLLAALQQEIRRFEVLVAQAIQHDPLWSRLDTAFREIKGVSHRTIAYLLAFMPEIGTLTAKAVAKLAGLAPIVKDSGKHKARRFIAGGRADVRTILYLVAEVARRYNDDLADFHRRLSQAGKPKKVVRIALARKILVQLNAKARQARPNVTQTA